MLFQDKIMKFSENPYFLKGEKFPAERDCSGEISQNVQNLGFWVL